MKEYCEVSLWHILVDLKLTSLCMYQKNSEVNL